MIKKSLFEKELETSMSQELRKMSHTNGTPDLVKAGECLHAALEIFEEMGLTSKANAVLSILKRVAHDGQEVRENSKVINFPTSVELARRGFTEKDMREMHRGSPVAQAKLNSILYDMGYRYQEIKSILGEKALNPKQMTEAFDLLDPNRSFGKIWEYMQDPTKPIDPNNPQPGESITMSRVPQSQLTPLPGDTISFESMTRSYDDKPLDKDEVGMKSLLHTTAKGHRKPKRPDKIHDPHTKGLTSKKMVENLLHHGTEFNMADVDAAMDELSADLDPDIADALGADRADDLDLDVPQGPEFEEDWVKWKAMQEPKRVIPMEEIMMDETPPPTLPEIPVYQSPRTLFQTPEGDFRPLRDVDDASDIGDVEVNDALEVTEKPLPQDFEDEID